MKKMAKPFVTTREGLKLESKLLFETSLHNDLQFEIKKTIYRNMLNKRGDGEKVKVARVATERRWSSVEKWATIPETPSTSLNSGG